MKFDVICGNPPFNEASKSKKTIAGTSGNVVLYRKYIKKAFELSKDNINCCLIIPKKGIKQAQEIHPNIIYKLDTSDYWNINAGCFITTSSKTKCIDNIIIQKTCDYLNPNWNFRNAIGGSYEKLKESGIVSLTQKDNSIMGLIELPSAKNPNAIVGYINRKSYLESKPKLMFKGLESMKSYFVTGLPAYVGSACCFFFDTIEEANKIKLFVINNKLVKYLNKKFNEKTLGTTLNYIKKFDISQIQTGFEYPKEWNLTRNDIDLIENDKDTTK